MIRMNNKEIILFGAGKIGKHALNYFQDKVYCFCDNNKNMWDKTINNKKIIGFENLLHIYDKEKYNIILTISDRTAIMNIVKSLFDHGINEFDIYSTDMESANPKSNIEIFSQIYKNNLWGGGGFYSGPGSRDNQIINPYIKLLKNLLSNNKFSSICDIGCGDFWIMRQVLNNTTCKYYGIDVVPNLIAYNNEHFGNGNIQFINMDASKEDKVLPAADLLIIRQVLQHLNNHDIQIILNKSKNYKYVLITEHIYEGEYVQYNLDKTVGADIRVSRLSGIYVEKAPFSMNNIIHLLHVPQDEGVIRTSLIINSNFVNQ